MLSRPGMENKILKLGDVEIDFEARKITAQNKQVRAHNKRNSTCSAFILPRMRTKQLHTVNYYTKSGVRTTEVSRNTCVFL